MGEKIWIGSSDRLIQKLDSLYEINMGNRSVNTLLLLFFFKNNKQQISIVVISIIYGGG